MKTYPSKWGKKPDQILKEYLSIIPKGNVFDLGIGDGRNSLFLAKEGFKIEGIDISEENVKKCIQIVEQENLEMNIKVEDFRKMEIPENNYTFIVCAWSLNFCKKSEAHDILEKVKKGVKNDGFIYFGGFSVENPSYQNLKNNSEEIEENTFYSPKLKSYTNFFTTGEIMAIFSGFETISLLTGIILDIDHDKPHYHGIITYMGRKNR